MLIPPEEIRQAQQVLAVQRAVDARRRLAPWEWYVPHPKQLAFHQSTHAVRALFPGNRFGKTSAAAMEVQWFCTGTHPYWPMAYPNTPGDAIWACPSNTQFEILLKKLRSLIFGVRPKWYESDHMLEFPGGGRLYAWSKERDWDTLKGISPRVIAFDEDALPELWNEAKARAYDVERMSTIITNTPTEALGTFMETDVYQPWLDHHAALGLTEDEAIERQLHPKIWCMTRGGIADNPTLAHREAEFAAEEFGGGEAEKAVRLRGGFRMIGAGSVFASTTLQRLDEEIRSAGETYGIGTTGYLRPADRPILGLKGMLKAKVSALKDKKFRWEREEPDKHGRITIWEHPRQGRQYTMGFDAAYGLEDGDWDAVCILDITESPAREVCSAWGHWGNRLGRVVYPLATYFNDAYIMGERQVGLFTLQELANEFEYDDLYRQRKVDTRTKAVTERLGWPRVGNDITLQTLRDRLDDGAVLLRCPETLRDMQRLIWERPERGVGVKRDSKVRGVMLRGGGSPDRIIARCYAVQAIDEVMREDPKKVKRKPKGWEYEGLPEDADDEPEKDAVDEMFGS